MEIQIHMRNIKHINQNLEPLPITFEPFGIRRGELQKMCSSLPEHFYQGHIGSGQA